MQIPYIKSHVLNYNIIPKNIKIWPAPKSIKDLQKLFRYMRFDQNMIKKYTERTSSMIDLFKINNIFE